LPGARVTGSVRAAGDTRLRAAGRGRPRVAEGNAGFAITARRLLAAVALLASATAFYGVTSSAAFELDRLEIAGASKAAPLDVRRAVEAVIGERPNLFRVRIAEIAQAVLTLPAVRAAEIHIALPDRLVVSVSERAPMLTWQTETGAFVVDVEGRLFLAASGNDAPAAFPLVRDAREFSRTFELGSWLGPADLAAVRQLGALTPQALGSKASALHLTVDDTQGWTLTAEPRSWRAIFGFYTSRSRRPDLIPAQVQCLRALLARGESKVDRVYLGRPGERCGTYAPSESR
jgi:cell division septal protein FtsQ